MADHTGKRKNRAEHLKKVLILSKSFKTTVADAKRMKTRHMGGSSYCLIFILLLFLFRQSPSILSIMSLPTRRENWHLVVAAINVCQKRCFPSPSFNSLRMECISADVTWGFISALCYSYSSLVSYYPQQ